MRAKKARKAAKSFGTTATAIAALHETNLALAMAAGFVGPRFEKAAAIDSHTAAGHLVLAERLGDVDLGGARGDLPYGVTVLVEIDTRKLTPDTNGMLLCAPLSAVIRATFPSQSSLADFKARQTGFGDVPSDVVDMAVSANDFAAGKGVTVSHLVANPQGQEESRRLDAFAGAVAAIVAGSNIMNASAGINALSGVADAKGHAGGLDKILAGALKRLDIAETSDTSTGLIGAIISALKESREREGFDARSTVDCVRAALSAQMSNAAGHLKMLAAAEDVIALRRDLSEDAFQDSDGLVVPRGFLLFLLNPDPDRLGAVPTQVKNLGARVFIVACAFAGYAAGFARLPKGLKAPTRDAYLGVSEFALQARQGTPHMDVRCRWNADGGLERELVLSGFTVMSAKESPDKHVSSLLGQLDRLGYRSSVDPATGRVSFELGVESGKKIHFICDRSESPTFPAQECLRISSSQTSFRSAKEVTLAIATVNAGGKIFARALSPKQRGVEYWVYCLLPVATEHLAASVNALVAAVTPPASESSLAPEQQEIFQNPPTRSQAAS